MWGGVPGAPPPPQAGGGMAYGGIQQGSQQQQQQQKHDIFVGNLAFTTTEDQLHQAFSEIGRVIKVRMVTDMDTGKPRGFAFIEFEDPQVALSAIRNMNDYELNGRRIRVNFSNSSHLEALAGRLGMDLSQQTQRSSGAGAGSGAGGASSVGSGTQAVAESLKSMSKGEMYDVVAKLKEIADRDPDEARRLLSGHPQLPEAILHLMSKLEMIKTPVSTEAYTGLNPAAAPGLPPPPPPQTTAAAPPQRAADPRARVDPRMAAAATKTAPVPRKDPRVAMDPRQQQQAPPPIPPPPQQPQYNVPPPSMQGPPAAVSNLDPVLVQQVMSLSPQQIAQLPPDKQQSILALRQQITGGR